MTRMLKTSKTKLAAAIVLGAGAIVAGAAWSPAVVAGTAVAASATTASQPETVYALDKVHSVALFRVRHAGVGFFWGRFNAGDGEFFIDTDNPSNSFFRATIQMASVDTGNESRDKHLQAADFFNARQFPTATFESTGFRAAGGENMYELMGDLTFMGETKPITAAVEFGGNGTFRGKETQGFEAVFEIKRTEWGLSTYVADDGGEGGGLGNTVRIVLGVEGQKQ
ncbi:MAG: YceI family protein [Planctomycetota bacterium]